MTKGGSEPDSRGGWLGFGSAMWGGGGGGGGGAPPDTLPGPARPAGTLPIVGGIAGTAIAGTHPMARPGTGCGNGPRKVVPLTRLDFGIIKVGGCGGKLGGAAAAALDFAPQSPDAGPGPVAGAAIEVVAGTFGFFGAG